MEGLRHYCSRCRASVPVGEWKLSRAGKVFEHLGPMRDGPGRLAGLDEGGRRDCGFVVKIPEKAGRDA